MTHDEETRFVLDHLVIAHCCRDWPVSPLSPMGRCGECGQTPKYTDKTIETYMAERREGTPPS